MVARALSASASERARLAAIAFAGAVGLVLVAAPIGLVAAVSPAHAVLGVIALATVVLCSLRVDLALLLFIAGTPLESAFSISANPYITVTKVTGALCFASFAIYAVVSHRKLRFDQTHVIVFLILALALLSTLQAREFNPAVQTTVRYASFAALYVVVSQLIGDHVLQRRLAWVLSISASVAGILGIQRFLSDATYQATLQYGDPNDLAFMLATTLPLTIWLLRERWLFRPIVVLMIGTISLSVLLTYSRGALLGLAAATLFLIATERRRLPILFVGGLVTLIAAMAFTQGNAVRVEEGFDAKAKVAERNVQTRLDAWNAAVDLAATHPLLGVGPGNFREHYIELEKIPPGAEPLGVVHNAYLDVAAELGVPAMLLFLAYIAQAFARMTLARRWENGLPGFASAVRLSFVVAIFSAFTLSEQYYAPFWLLGALGTALWAEGRQGTGMRELTPLVRRPVPAELAERSGPDDEAYDLDMRVRVVEQRERAVAEQQRELRAEQVRLERRAKALDVREAELAELRRELEKGERPLRAGKGQERAGAAGDEGAGATGRRRSWRFAELDKLVTAAEDRFPDRVPEWRIFLGHLRSFTDQYGFLPASFDPLLREIFAPLVEKSA